LNNHNGTAVANDDHNSSITNTSAVTQKSPNNGGIVKKPGIININKDKSTTKKFIFANGSKKTTAITGISNTNTTTTAAVHTTLPHYPTNRHEST